MSLLESLKHLPEDLAAAIRRATESGDAEVSVEPGLEIKMKLVIRPGSSGDDLDLDGKSLEELEELLNDLQRVECTKWNAFDLLCAVQMHTLM